jgi:hypothetical protein
VREGRRAVRGSGSLGAKLLLARRRVEIRMQPELTRPRAGARRKVLRVASSAFLMSITHARTHTHTHIRYAPPTTHPPTHHPPQQLEKRLFDPDTRPRDVAISLPPGSVPHAKA